MSTQAARASRFEELRTSPRVPVEVVVSLESENNFYAGITNNISEGGVFVATHMPPERGAVVDLLLTLPGSLDALAVRCRVCWIRDSRAATVEAPAGCGLSFVDLPPSALEAIRRFISQRDTILYDAD